VVPFVLMLFSLTDVERGFARGQSIAAGPPRRNATQRASLLDWVGLRALNEERYDVAQVAFRDLCAETPIPHALKLWGASALIVGQPREAEQAFTQLVAGSAADPVGWYGLWMSAGNLGDTLVTQRAAQRIRTWDNSGPEMRAVVEFLDHYPRLYSALPRAPGASPR
jgi:predicted Zn-dependent protease